jgi:hypothetical protein
MRRQVRITWQCAACGTHGVLVWKGPLTRQQAYMAALSDHQMLNGTVRDTVTTSHLELFHFKVKAIAPGSSQQSLPYQEEQEEP